MGSETVQLNQCPKKATRYAAYVLVGGGVVGFLSNHVVMDYKLANDVIAALDIVVGLVAWFLPWHRWPSRTTLVLVPMGFALIGLSRSLGTVLPPAYGVSYVMVFMWIGHTHPPRTSFWVAPLAAFAYIAPTVFAASGDPAYVEALPVVLPVCILAAEVPARMLARLALANQAEHAEAEAFAEAAQTDDLTGLGNRRRGNALLDSLSPGDAVLLLDLDHFKEINDRDGHSAGDRFLMEFGHFLAEHVRDADDVARYGGEEFIVVLREARESARSTAERLLAAWRALTPLTTFSVGIAVHPEKRSPAWTFAEADRALYDAKRTGRNRVCVHGDPPTPTPTPGPTPAPAPAHNGDRLIG